MVMRGFGWVLVGAVLAGCNVEATSQGTGGASLDGGLGGASLDGGGASLDGEPEGSSLDGAPRASCSRALVVASSDYTSTNVSVLAPTGEVLSSSLISSASAAPGLTTALSGDVVFPSAAPASGALVLIDRYPNSVLTWVDPATAQVQAQMQVGTGFVSNPHDYLEVSPTKAYVTRYETNAKAGQQANDGGGDVLIINPTTREITGRIALAQPDDGDILPRPGNLLQVGNRVWVSLQRTSEHFDRSGDARIVAVDPADDSVAWSLDLPGAVGCGGWSISPSRAVVALACASLLGEANAADHGAIVLLDATAEPPAERQRISTAALGAPLGSPIAFVSETLLLGVALGDDMAARTDVAFTVDTTIGAPTVIANAGSAFSFGDVRCTPGCANRCMITDASAKGVRVWNIEGGALVEAPSLTVDTTIGLPPRSFGTL